LVLLAILAAVPRLINLLGLDPFVDEAAWVDWATREFVPSSPGTWFTPLLHDGRPPLHFWLMLPLAAVVDNGILAGRLAAALAGVASTLALYGLGRDIASRTVGVSAAVLWALSPFTVMFARIAADDALLALMAILAVWASVRFARCPTIPAAILLGLVLGFGVLAKTTGALFVIAPPLAILLLGRPREWRSYAWPLTVAALVSLLAVIPLIIWWPEVLAELRHHATPVGTGDSPFGSHLLVQNAEIVSVWVYQFVGGAFPLLVALGLVAALIWRQWALLLVTLLGVLWLAVLLDRGTSFFSRYLLFGVFPAYLLAGYALDRLATVVSQWVPPLPRTGEGVRGWGPRAGGWSGRAWAPRLAIVIVGIGIVVWPKAGLLRDIIKYPAQAAIPEGEHYRYVEQWFAVYGLGQIAQELQARGSVEPVTVLVPPASREDRVMIPYGALRSFLRGDDRVRFVEVPVLFRAQDLRDVRRAARDGPTYLLLNGTYTDAPGTPNDVPGYTRRFEDRLARDVPEARPILRIDRPSAPNWLTLYRLDPGD
jgi:4-amino-4-deoxy-L-arabinose transferase-like glycosyltransferase